MYTTTRKQRKQSTSNQTNLNNEIKDFNNHTTFCTGTVSEVTGKPLAFHIFNPPFKTLTCSWPKY